MAHQNIWLLGGHNAKDVTPGIMNGFSNEEDTNSYRYLCRSSQEKCEFCDKISKTRYSSIIHNAKHIIIPLIKQRVYQCEECLHHFTSERNLIRHVRTKHENNTKGTFLVDTETIDVDNYIPKKIEKHNSKIARFDPNLEVHDKVAKCDSKIAIIDSKRTRKDSIVAPSNDKIEKCDSKIAISDCRIGNRDYKVANGDSIIKNQGFKMKSRLLFEEDICQSDMILTDLTTDCKVNLELFKSPWMRADEEFVGKTVSYGVLVQPGMYRCKKCSRTFPNRFDSIVHETQHLSLQKCRRLHCSKCNNTYISLKRLENHLVSHKFNIDPKGGKNDTDVDLPSCQQKNIDNKNDFKEISRIMNLCDMCFTFTKNTQGKKYFYLGGKNVVGKRFSCDRCGALCFELNIVELRMKSRAERKDYKQRKVLSNEDRLKHIKQRLKMLKN